RAPGTRPLRVARRGELGRKAGLLGASAPQLGLPLLRLGRSRAVPLPALPPRDSLPHALLRGRPLRRVALRASGLRHSGRRRRAAPPRLPTPRELRRHGTSPPA